ncbi:MAG TPA: RHS repeat-associated core domain-containing protein [Phycisphaerales bacterium]|nr:RHS repeat-associated core domain-containing protein [Phycisphaerales bacterium]
MILRDYDDWDDMFTGGATNAKAPVDLNGDGLFPDTTDYDLFLASYHSTTGMRGGYNKLGATIASSVVISPQNRIGYAGYQWDPAIKQYHVRHRVYNAEVGRWLTRDPKGYVDGPQLCSYVAASPLRHADPDGTTITDKLPGKWVPEPEPSSPFKIWLIDTSPNIIIKTDPSLPAPAPFPALPGSGSGVCMPSDLTACGVYGTANPFPDWAGCFSYPSNYTR